MFLNKVWEAIGIMQDELCNLSMDLYENVNCNACRGLYHWDGLSNGWCKHCLLEAERVERMKKLLTDVKKSDKNPAKKPAKKLVVKRVK